jgi:threonine/homoserine/homoserine lactone efflux protein
MNTILEGIILGLTLAIFFGFGPALVALIQTSIHRGLWPAFQLAFGIFLSDVTLVSLGFIGAVQIFNQYKSELGIIGGIILILFGIVTFRRKVVLDMEGSSTNEKNHGPGFFTYVFKGFLINFTNPFIWLFWMGVVVGFTTNYEGDEFLLISFFAAALGTVFFIDLLKSFSAYQIKRYIQTHNIIWINRFAGIGLVLFGFYLVLRTYFEMGI